MALNRSIMEALRSIAKSEVAAMMSGMLKLRKSKSWYLMKNENTDLLTEGGRETFLQ